MTEEQRLHAELIVKILGERLITKYTAGAKEHGGNIWELDDKQLDYEELMEIIDLAVYKITRMINQGTL